MQDNKKDASLCRSFNLNKTLEIKDDKQLKRVKNKMDYLINSKKMDFLFITKNNKNQDDNSKMKFKNLSNEVLNEIYYSEVIIKNAILSVISLGAYSYFNRFTDFLNIVNSVYYYKKLFLITFCVLPILLNFKFSKMNYEFKILELSLRNDNIKRSLETQI